MYIFYKHALRFQKKRLLLGKSYRNFTQHFKDTIQMLTLELIIGCQYSVLAHMSVEAIAGRAIFGVPRSMAVLVAAVLEPYCQYWPYWRVLEGMLAVLRCIGANLPYPRLPLCP